MQDLVGPKVSARREGTADSGGGRLEVRAGRVVVQGKLRTRDLGPAVDLSEIALLDGAGTGASFAFAGGATWTLATEAGGLEEFARAMETALARPDLVKAPPRLSERVRAVATSETRRSIGAVLLVLVLGVVAIVGALWAQDERRREAIEAVAQRRAAAGRADRERAEHEARLREDARAATLAGNLRAAIDQQRWRDAEGLHAALAKLRPDHPLLRPAWATLGPALDAAKEEGRKAAVAAGIEGARAALADPVRCDDAHHVAESWKGLAQARRADPGWRDAVVLASQLERCRVLVEKGYAANAASALRDERRRFSLELPDRLRGEGQAVVTRIGGRDDTALTIEIAALDDARARSLVTLPVFENTTLLQRADALGMRTVRLTDGAARHFDYALDPPPTGPGVKRWLAVLGLDEPFAVGDASDLAAATKRVTKPASPAKSRRPHAASRGRP